MKNVILITSHFPYGGASANLLRYFSFCLADHGHLVEVFLPTGAFYGNKLDQHPSRKGVINGIKFQRLGLKNHPKNMVGKLVDNVLGLILPFYFLLKKCIQKKFDLLVLYSPTATTLIFHLAYRIILRKELLIILPEFYEKPRGSLLSTSIIKWYNFYVGIKFFAKYADKYIVLSEYLNNYLKKQGRSSKDILIMPNLTDPSKYICSKIKDFKPNKITIGYVGTPTKKDGINDLIKSFSVLNKLYPNTHLLIIGDITNGNTIIPQLKEYSEKQGINSCDISFTGLTSHSKTPNLLLSCQILALTRPNGISAEAGFPTKLGEYFATKKPVVLTGVGDMKAYLKDKEHVVFAKPENIASIVDSFVYIIKNPERAAKIGENGYRWMNTNLNYKRQGARISDFIES